MYQSIKKVGNGIRDFIGYIADDYRNNATFRERREDLAMYVTLACVAGAVAGGIQGPVGTTREQNQPTPIVQEVNFKSEISDLVNQIPPAALWTTGVISGLALLAISRPRYLGPGTVGVDC